MNWPAEQNRPDCCSGRCSTCGGLDERLPQWAGNPFHPAFTPAPSVIVGQSGKKTAAAPIPPPQNETKYPLSYRLTVIVGQKWRYTTRMTHNNENSPAGCRAKLGKPPQPGRRRGPLTRMTHDQVPIGRRAAEPRFTRMEKVQRVHGGSSRPDANHRSASNPTLPLSRRPIQSVVIPVRSVILGAGCCGSDPQPYRPAVPSPAAGSMPWMRSVRLNCWTALRLGGSLMAATAAFGASCLPGCCAGFATGLRNR
jgi:hypothetical protein